MKIKFNELEIQQQSYYKHFFVNIKGDDYEKHEYVFQRKVKAETQIIKQHYFSIERKLIQSFYYVMPVYENISVFSTAFMEVITESCIQFEKISKKFILDFFKIKNGLNINDYLAMEKYLEFTKEDLKSYVLLDNLIKNECIKPFQLLEIWDKNSDIDERHVPEWWHVYNSIKHDPSANYENATLKNALLAIAALFILIKKIFGSGVICGRLTKPMKIKNEVIHQYIDIPISELFFDENGSLGVSYI